MISCVACILMHEWTTHKTLFITFRVFTISCNKLHATGALFHIVACILMHERIMHRTLFNPFGIHDFVCSVHLDARKNHSQNVIHHRSGIHDFVRSVHLDARQISLMSFFYSCNKLHATGKFHLGAWLTISCNELHATGALFHIVACILMHERFPLWACFFVQQVARYGEIPPRCVINDFVQQVARYDSFIFKAFDGARFTACADNRLI